MIRLQRLRKSAAIRNLVAETTLGKNDFIMPVFVNENIAKKKEIASLPGIAQHSLSSLLTEVGDIAKTGIQAILLFGTPKKKDARGSASYDANGIAQNAIRAIKKAHPNLIVIADCCLCAYTSNGACHLNSHAETLSAYAKIANTYAEAGADVIAPSGMMDGMVSAIRHSLDAKGHEMIPIMSYAVKYASSFYGPFRDAAGSADAFQGDRKHHQLAPSQCREGLREAEADLAEGADMLIVKPALGYQDMICRLRQKHDVPIVAYNVSGEYAMLHSLPNAKEAFTEVFLGLKRAGADLIISYFAKEFVQGI
jgi:porphobilinogen synthase